MSGGGGSGGSAAQTGGAGPQQPCTGFCGDSDASDEQLDSLLAGVSLKDGLANAVTAIRIESPASLWDREPPIRYRKTVTDSWIEITLAEGRNRQIRRQIPRPQ